MTSSPPIVISRLDCERLEALLEQVDAQAYPELRSELERGELREPRAMPGDVISMNSRARFRDRDTGAEREITLVYPRDADGSGQRVSVLAPVGSALLGLRIGQAIDWPMPGGRSTRLEVVAIDYQPEAAGDFHR